MKSPVVRLKLRVRLPDGNRACLDPAYSKDHKLRSGYAVSESRRSLPTAYHLRYLRGDRRVWEPVGRDAEVAATSLVKRERELAAIAANLPLLVAQSSMTSRLMRS